MKQSASGNQLPLRRGAILKGISRFLLTASGWKIDNSPPDLKKMIVIVAPHTSNWDFILALLVMFACELKASWLGKHTIFKGMFGTLLKKIGGIPVNRAVSHGVVKAAANAFQSNEKLILGLAPEGTRKKVNQWKMGFYHIARKADVPVVPAYLDYKRKRVGFGPARTMSADMEKELSGLKDFYRNVTPRHSHKF